MTGKYVLFLNLRGIVLEQEKALIAARNAGFEVILLSNNMPQQMKDFIAIFEPINTTNPNDIFNRAIELSKIYTICGVFSWTDTDVVVSAKISKALGLLAPHEDAVYLSKNKYEMRKCVHQTHPEWVPAFIEIASLSDIENNSENFPFPAVIKPISASGSKGIFIVQNKEEAIQALQQLIDLSKDKDDSWLYTRYGEKYIMEEYIGGQEVSVEGFVYEGECYIAGITDKKTTYPWCIEYRHIFPALLTNNVKLAIETATKKVVKALNLDYCPIHLEAKWVNNEFKLIEIAARTGGDLIHSHLIAHSLGFDWLEMIIDSIANKHQPIFSNNPQKLSGIQFLMAETSRMFSGLTLDDALKRENDIICVEETLSRGSLTALPPDDFASQRVGFVLVCADTFEQVEYMLGNVINNISF
jgi:carbamoylphosphate synthase large subunit